MDHSGSRGTSRCSRWQWGKLVLAVAWLTSVSAVAQAQWLDSGTTWTNSGGSATYTQDNIGIGVTSPSNESVTATTTRLGVTGGLLRLDATGDTGLVLRRGALTNGAWFVFSDESQDLRFYEYSGLTAVGERLRITNEGNVGIGATNPGEKLDVAGSISLPVGSYYKLGVYERLWRPGQAIGGVTYAGTYGPTLTYNVKYNAGWKSISGGMGAALGITEGRLFFSNTNAFAGADQSANWYDRFVIEQGGNIGIGTTAPNIGGASNNFTVATIRGPVAGALEFANSANTSSSNGHLGLIEFYNGTIETSRIHALTSGADSGYLALYTKAAGSAIAERIRVTDAGQVGIGTPTPGSVLDVRYVPGTNIYRASDTAGQYRWRVDQYFDMYMTTGSGADTMVIKNNGDIGIGTISPNAKLDVVGNATFSGTVTGGNIVAKYQDVAEWVPSVQVLDPGTVVVLDRTRTNHVLASSQTYDTRVAGVVSEMPGLLLGEAGEGKVKVATTGRVKVKVDANRGPIEVGDLLVTGQEPGTAMRSEPVDVGGVPMHRPGTVIGKALEPLDEGQGEILVLLSLQ